MPRLVARHATSRTGRRVAQILITVGLVAASTTTALAVQNEASPPPHIRTTAAPLCGASLEHRTGETWQQALDRADTAYNGLESVRIFYSGLPQAWPGRVDTGSRSITVSFKASPSAIISNQNGTLDALRQWFASAPTNKEIYWSYYHEPEDNIRNGEFSAQQYRDAWKVLANAADSAGNSHLHATLILMEWSLQSASGRDWRDYYPGVDTIDVLAWDAYSASTTSYRSPSAMFDKIVQISGQEGLPFAIAETGSGLVSGDSGTARAQWLRNMASYLTTHGAVFAQYFDLDWRSNGGPDYRLSDSPSRQAWAEFCS